MTAKSDVGLKARLERHIDELPVLPMVIARLMSLDRAAPDYFDQVLKLIEGDPNLSARTLASSNSAASAPRTPITTLRGAVTRVGSLTASNLVLALAVTRVFVPRDAWEKSLWRHALQVSVAARSLAVLCHDQDLSPEEVYAAALLHDVGRFVLFQEAPDQLRRIDEGDWECARELVEFERSICGMTHTELGAMACAKWHLPEVVTAVVRDHHTVPTHPPHGKLEKMTALVRLADLAMFPSAMPGSPGLDQADDATMWNLLAPKIPFFLKIDVAGMRAVLVATVAEADATCRELGVA